MLLSGMIAKPICNVIFGFIKYLCKLPKLMVHFIDGELPITMVTILTIVPIPHGYHGGIIW